MQICWTDVQVLHRKWTDLCSRLKEARRYWTEFLYVHMCSVLTDCIAMDKTESTAQVPVSKTVGYKIIPNQ